LPGSDVRRLFVAKGARVFYSGTLSILIPQYIIALGYSDLYLGVALVAILAGNVASNLALAYLEPRLGKKRVLQAFSVAIVASGIGLATLTPLPGILAACFLGNISTTGTEAGPFQSIEAGVLPDLAGGRAAEAFGRYNLIGYAASAVGALAAGAPALAPGGLTVYRVAFGGFAGLGVLLLAIYSRLDDPRLSEATPRLGFRGLEDRSRKDLTTLSALFSLDAFGGSFVSQYVLASWFLLQYGVSSGALGGIFFVASVIMALSVYGAALLARKLGNLRTMVYTHLVSNAFLVAIPLAGSLAGALVFLFLRQSLSQMDVPTRQALMTEMFRKDERVTAFALSNTARSVSSFAGGPVSTALIAAGLLSGMLFLGGFSKMAYDLAAFATYHRRFP
jgi:MFS family permease